MNHIDHKLTHEKAVAAGLTVLRRPTGDDLEPGRLWEIQVAASALEKAAIRLRAVPNYPDCHDVRASYRNIVQECIEDMRKVLSDA